MGVVISEKEQDEFGDIFPGLITLPYAIIVKVHPSALPDLIKSAAADAGFELCGIAPVQDFPEPAPRLSAFRFPLGAKRRGLRDQLQHCASVFDRSQGTCPWLDLPLRLVPRGLPRFRSTPPSRSRRKA